jgi:hypothetical protein
MPRVGFEPMTPMFERAKTLGHCERQDASILLAKIKWINLVRSPFI